MRVMAIDYGDARTGVAISDMTGSIAGETMVIHERDRSKLIDNLIEIVHSRKVEAVAVGHPKNMDGTLGERAMLCEALAEDLKDKADCPVQLWDERRTTADAHRILHASGSHGRKNKGKVDAVAAALILEGYLGSLRR